MFVFIKPTSAPIEPLNTELQRKRQFAAQLREEAVGLWAEDYLALAELEDAKADVIEAQMEAMRRLQAFAEAEADSSVSAPNETDR